MHATANGFFCAGRRGGWSAQLSAYVLLVPSRTPSQFNVGCSKSCRPLCGKKEAGGLLSTGFPNCDKKETDADQWKSHEKKESWERVPMTLENESVYVVIEQSRLVDW
jgi:hypothetical protein